jgi:hypothetical protein
VLGALAAAGAGYFLWLRVLGGAAMNRVLADLDTRRIPWTFEDLEATRPFVPPGENSAVHILAAYGALPRRWSSVEQSKVLEDLSPATRLDPAQAALFRTTLEAVPTALNEARKVAVLPRGRYAISWAPDGISTALPHLDQAREVARLLQYDALRRAHDNDLDGALESTLAAVNVSRSLSGEPSLVSALVRIACRSSLGLPSLERVLAQGEPSDAQLARLQQALVEDESDPLLQPAMRGELVTTYALLEALASGQRKLGQIGFKPPRPWKDMPVLDQVLDSTLTPVLEQYSLSQRSAVMKYLGDVIDINRLPIEEQCARLEELRSTTHSPLALHLWGNLPKFGERCRASTAQLRCAILMLAAERYRRVHGKWPSAINDILAGLPPQIGRDPYDRKTLRLKRLADGLVIYSVGPNMADDGGDISHSWPGAGAGASKDVGFRLWDPVHRRRAPPPDKTPALTK